MKVLVSDYSFNATAKTITFNGYTSISLANVLLITNTTDNIIIYNFASPTKGGSVAGNVLTLDYDTTTMSNTDELQVFYDDPNGTQATVDANKQNVTAYAEVLTAGASITPASGKKIKVLKVQVMQNPDNSASNAVTLNFTSIGDFVTGWAYSDSTEWVGATDEALNINLASAAPVSVNIRYREI